MRNFIHYFLCMALGVIVSLSIVRYGLMPLNTTSEIKELRVAQDKWVEQVELLIVIDRLSFNLQNSELDNKEMFRALGNAVRANNDLRLLVRQLMNQQHRGNASGDFAVPPLGVDGPI